VALDAFRQPTSGELVEPATKLRARDHAP
jgi:hypothetical protein